MSIRVLFAICLLLTASIAIARDSSDSKAAKRFEIGFSLGRMESIGVAHDLYDSHSFGELMLSWKPGIFKSLRLQARFGGRGGIESFSNKVVYYSDSSTALLAEDISSGIFILSIGVDYSVPVSTKPAMALRFGLGLSQTNLKYNSTIEIPVTDSLTYGSGRKSDDLGKSITSHYLRGGLEISLSSQVVVMAEITRLVLPEAYQEGGFALGQYGPKLDLSYYIFGLNWILRL